MPLSVKYNALISVTFKVRVEKNAGEMTQLLKARLTTTTTIEEMKCFILSMFHLQTCLMDVEYYFIVTPSTLGLLTQ